MTYTINSPELRQPPSEIQKLFRLRQRKIPPTVHALQRMFAETPRMLLPQPTPNHQL